jgi:hypothetical protein
MNDREAIEGVALDYYEGWFEGDAVRMERALHPDLVKRCVDGGSGAETLLTLSAREMVEATAEGSGRQRDLPDRGIEVEIEHTFGTIANVTVVSNAYGAEYLQLVRTAGRWKIVNVVWMPTAG